MQWVWVLCYPFVEVEIDLETLFQPRISTMEATFHSHIIFSFMSAPNSIGLVPALTIPAGASGGFSPEVENTYDFVTWRTKPAYTNLYLYLYVVSKD